MSLDFDDENIYDVIGKAIFVFYSPKIFLTIFSNNFFFYFTSAYKFSSFLKTLHKFLFQLSVAVNFRKIKINL